MVEDNDNKKTKLVLRASVVAPGLDLEIPLGERLTLLINPYFGTSFEWISRDGTNSFDLEFIPAISLQSRFYFDQKKREAEGMRTDYFSGSYTGLITSVSSPGTFLAGQVIGYQQAFGKRLFFNISGGPGLVIYQAWNGRQVDFTIAGDIGLGIILNP